MSLFRADLHCHSSISDGSDSPEALLQIAVARGLQGLSITDHDTMAGYTPSLFALAQKLSLALLPGVEISTEWKGLTVHILGYGMRCTGQDTLGPFLEEVQQRRERRNRFILDNLRARGMPLTDDELPRHRGRPHMADLMVKKGYVASVRDAFGLYLKEGAMCAATGFFCSPQEGIDAIHRAGGKAILAHPHRFQNRADVLRLFSFAWDGIECYYSILRQEADWLFFAQERGWIATGGSDYHGTRSPNISLGASWVNRETFEELSSHAGASVLVLSSAGVGCTLQE